MSTLQPAAQDATGTVDAQWRKVEVGSAAGLDGSDCELAEQIIEKILSHFATRNLQADTRCIPHQRPTGMLTFSVETLSPIAGNPTQGH
jgi:hypothetical protein